MENLEHILVFKTDIKTEKDKCLLQQPLDRHSAIEQWSVDLDDEDCVLRIVSRTLDHRQVIELVNHHGFTCCELI